MRLSLVAIAASTLSICSTALAHSTVYIVSEKNAANQIQSNVAVPETSFASFATLLSHILGTSDRHTVNVQDAKNTFSLVNDVLASSPALDRSNLFSKLKGSMFISVGGVRDSQAVLPTYDPTLTVRDDRSEDFVALMSDHNNYQIQRSSFREDGVTRFFDGEEIYVADDDEAFERFKIAYPEINVGVFDMSNDVSYTQMTEQNVYKVTNLAFGFISGCHQADKTFVAEIEHVQNTVKDFVLARADSVKHKTDYLTIHMTSLEGLLTAHGASSDQYATAQSVLKDLFAKTLIPDFEQAYESDEYAFSTFILSPTVKSRFQKRAPPAPSAAPDTCFKNIATCEKETDHCSGRGSCGAVVDTQCYACTCNSTKYLGDSCQVEDISSDFQLLFWTSVALILMVGGAIAALINLGENIESPPIVQVPTKQE
ncbi:hypothetical protein INT44_005726 [Umbelopsis vinacea]|uniref:Vacuolar sorting protein Vps3844 C-terminal domain-containing protein n=1 Tax=Umbelopsis vinacea TaxID=44442 RepID=A0A8H7Q118_9FUNG|nr:hypothetical protein INT44_005726 [Umbelopsis vinacea]